MDLQIFPNRILSAETTEEILKELDNIDEIQKIVLQGQRLTDINDPDKKTINVKGEEIDLQIKTGRILMEIKEEENIDHNEVAKKIQEVAEPHLPFGFDVYGGTFIRKEKTVTDKLKYGEKLDDMPDEMIGLTDQSAHLSKRSTILKSKKKE